MARLLRCDTLAGGLPLRALLFALLLLIPLTGYSEDAYGAVNSEVAEVLRHARIDSASEIVIGKLFLEAESVGISSELLLPRLQEGVSKSVDASLVIEALRSEITYLTAARDIVRRDPEGALLLEDQSNWFRAANFLRAGQSEATLLVLTRACAGRPECFRPATLLYLSISEWGIEEALSLELVRAVVVSNLHPTAYPEVTALLSDVQRAHMDLPAAVSQIARYLRDGRSLRQIARILRR